MAKLKESNFLPATAGSLTVRGPAGYFHVSGYSGKPVDWSIGALRPTVPDRQEGSVHQKAPRGEVGKIRK